MRLSHIDNPSLLSRFMSLVFALLVLATFTMMSVPVGASGTHAMHDPNASKMSQQDMIQEHTRDCVAACGSAERSEESKLSISQRKKEKEKLPFNIFVHEHDAVYQFPEEKYRTVFLKPQNKMYLRLSLLRL